MASSTCASRSISITVADSICTATASGNGNVSTSTVRNGGVSFGNVPRLGMKLERRMMKSWGASFFCPTTKLGVGANYCGRRGPQLIKAFGLDGQSSQAVESFAVAEDEPVKSFQWSESKVG